VAIARAVANGPALLLCDEPTGNLDKDTAATIVKVFGDLHREGTTIVCATHEPSVARAASTTISLREGRIATETLP
jgi:putative ABC transport system ATP-binding protein